MKSTTIIQFTPERWEEIIREHEAMRRRAEEAERVRDFFVRQYCMANGIKRAEALDLYKTQCAWGGI